MFTAALFKIAKSEKKFKCSVAGKSRNNSRDIHTMKYYAGTTKINHRYMRKYRWSPRCEGV